MGLNPSEARPVDGRASATSERDREVTDRWG